MKASLTALFLLSATAAAVGLYPTTHATRGPVVSPTPNPTPILAPVPGQSPRIEVVFVLDTTGSMGGLIQGAKDKIWSIATTMAQADPAPEIRMGLVAYRDRGDAYITQVTDLSTDLDSMYATLMEFQAAGGGDGPEDVNQALSDAVHRMSWSEDDQAYQVIFLVGDAPPHMDYTDQVPFPITLGQARDRGIVVNAIQCGEHGVTGQVWQQVAQLGSGRFFQVEQSGGAIAMSTPFDGKLASLSADLDATRVYFGSSEDRARAERKIEATEKLHAEAPAEVRAARASFNATAGGEANLLGDDELVDAFASGRVDLEELDADLLPEPIQAMSVAEQKDYLEEQSLRREALRTEIAELSAQRQSYLKKQADAEPAPDAFDARIGEAVREQAAAKGFSYASEEDKE